MSDRKVERGRFITFEGGEGAGKSTQVRRLVARLEAHGTHAIATREPGGSPKAEEMRKILLAGGVRSLGPMAEAILFSAARADHLEQTIRPALKRGRWVVSDRFADSTRAYQGALGKLDGGVIRALERTVVGATRPDLTLVLDLPPEVGLARASARRQAAGAGADRFEAEAINFHVSLRQAFRAIAEAEPHRCVVIDAQGGPDDVEEAIWSVVCERLPVEKRHEARQELARVS